MKAAFYTLGCKVNQYESTAMAQALEAEGFSVVAPEENADIYIINTCAVTSEGERKARQTIRRAISRNSNAYIIVTGCASQLNPQEISQIPGVDFVCGNKEKMAVVEAAIKYRENRQKHETLTDVQSVEGCLFEPMFVTKSERTRAYIKIEDGCGSKCAYCIIKTARGTIRSKTVEDTVREAKYLVSSGYREIVLCGIEISAYGKDIGCDLCDLLCELDKIEGLERIRLGSIDPAVMKPDFTDRLANISRLAPHFHLSLQSGCDKTLAAMRRRYTTETVLRYTDYIREKIPDATFTADVIVGFPNETDEDFLTTCAFIENIKLLDFHIFTFSKRAGTEAASMSGQILKAEKNRREKVLSEIRERTTAQVLNSFIGRTLPVLFEEYKNGAVFGHTANFIEVSAEADKGLHGLIFPVKLEKCEGTLICGSLQKSE